MKILNKFGIFLAGASMLWAAGENHVISQQGFFSVQGIYQNWEDQFANSISETSFPMALYYPLNRASSLYLMTSQASARATHSNALSGLSDSQLFWNYHLEDRNMVFNVTLNLPSGKNTLTSEEYRTSMLLGQNYWNFSVPNFGQGFNISPGVTWAIPASENVVFGFGASYSLKGAFQPLADLNMDYRPGNEIIFTGGADFRTAPLSNVSVDLIYTMYAADQFNNVEVFKSGSKIVASVSYKTHVGFHTLVLNGRFRSKTRNQLAGAGGLIEEPLKTYPNQIEFSGIFRYQPNPKWTIGMGLEGRSFEDLGIAKLPGLNLYGPIVTPQMKASDRVTMTGRFKYLMGSFSTDVSITGVEAGIGMLYRF